MSKASLKNVDTGGKFRATGVNSGAVAGMDLPSTRDSGLLLRRERKNFLLFGERTVPLAKLPKDNDRMHVKLFFGLFEGSASGPFAVLSVVILAVLAMVGRAAGML
ncbi:hypothetical protein CN233_14745 [Sinorhizobium meliloti]|uniref:Uncharacterized protein n=1 Tax=Rhizobium meliloti TaxID=382 RepID=A0AAW9TJ35_RHIML|nr:hypothetical protein [Sinorhizobium meliloti]MDX0999920.1 hypothetical protein [Sinorhizobium medicae]MQW31878.1 hypothetical protein [Sinorhizobium meliloti]QPI29088.1 hypothetical protein I0J99_30540 [Sinorhizobium meliloti]RVG31809.1 hypothetical protein CN233_14745 [Sinorhizobium meliloti]RVK97391.1 hypothetical protein CN152_18025 [Sinorhizobium meliloti]